MDSHALKPAAKWVKQRLTMRPRASLERHCHTSASLLPRQWHAVAGLATPALACWLKYAISVASQQELVGRRDCTPKLDLGYVIAPDHVQTGTLYGVQVRSSQ